MSACCPYVLFDDPAVLLRERRVGWLVGLRGRRRTLTPSQSAARRTLKFAYDSPLEGDGFELPVPQQIRFRFRGSSPVSHDRFDGLATRNRKFESISLQRRVRCEPDLLDQGHR